MKPMIALIATGVVLLLIMLYFGKTSFEGTFESNVYQNSPVYNKTAPFIKELEKQISNVQLKYIKDNNTTYLSYIFNDNGSKTYKSAVLQNIAVSYNNSDQVLPLESDNSTTEGTYVYKGKLNSGLTTVLFYYLINNQYTVKVLKSVYVE